MEEILTMRFPDEIRKMLNRTSKEISRDLRIYSALMMFRLGKLSSGAAASMAGVPRIMFLDLCSDYDIHISQISPEDLRNELSNE